MSNTTVMAHTTPTPQETVHIQMTTTNMSGPTTVPSVASSSASTILYANQLQQHNVQPVQLGLGGGQDHIHQQVTHTQLLPHRPQIGNVYSVKHTTMEMETVISLNQCCVCSTFFEVPARAIPHPDLNRMICKVLDVTPDTSFYKEYLPLCVNCTNLLRKFDRLRVELEFVKTQLVTYVMESLMQLRVDGGSQLDGLKDQIFDRWAGGQKEGRKKRKTKEGYTAVGTDDLSWAAHNNVMERGTTVTHIGNWSTSSVRPEAVLHESECSPPVEYQSGDDNDHGGDDLLHGGNDNDEKVAANNIVIDEILGENSKVPKDSSASPKKRKKKQKKKSTGQGVAPLICTNCGRIFSQRITFNGHVQVCTSDDLELSKNCSICSEEHNVPWVFETWEEFKAHVNSYHPLVKLETCNFCRVNFLPGGVKQHKCTQPYPRKVDKEAIFKCDRCDKAYNTLTNLVDHVIRIHKKDEQHKCDICDKVYGSPMLLGFHVKRHKKVVSKFQCKHCGVCLTTNYGLKEHTKRHTGEQPFDCKECGRKFTSLSALRCHKMIHGNQTPHVCHICGRGFKIRSTLSRHVARHLLDETNHTKKCPLCPKAMFRKLWILKAHMKREHSGTAELEQVLEKFKDIDDTPKKKDNRWVHGKGRACRKATKKEKKETDDESEFDEDEMSEDEISDEEDVKPVIDEDNNTNNTNEDPETVLVPPPSRQSARLIGKNAKKLVVVLSKENAQESDGK